MLRKMSTKLFLAMLAFGVMFVLATPDAMAQNRCRTRGRNVSTNYDYDQNYDSRDYRDRNYRNRDYRDTSYRDYDNRYRDREDTTGNAIKRTGIGAGIGAVSGAVIGGKKGALIGAGIGAAGGYLYHRKKVGDERDRRYRY